MHKTNYSEADIIDMIEPCNVERHYSAQTYWEPGEDYIKCDIDLNEKFKEVVQIVEFYCYGENPFAVVVNGNTLYLNEKDDWIKYLESLGWQFFDGPISDMKMSKSVATSDLTEWMKDIANRKAWDYVLNGDY